MSRVMTPRSRRTGFTLIELLVVIAIIAILAAILFPVFAQARAAARKSACLSNFKQITHGILMYAQDYDEVLPIAFSATTYWPLVIQPYVKNWDVFRCPEDPRARDTDYLAVAGLPENATGLILEQIRASFTDFGFNMHALAIVAGNSFDRNGISLAGVSNPTGTVLGADSAVPFAFWQPSNAPGRFYVGPPHGSDTTATAPWQVAGNNLWYGFVAPRHAGLANVAFVDGHVKSMTIGALTQGWDAQTNRITDPAQYLWDLQ